MSARDDREAFVEGCNVVVFEHLVVDPRDAQTITRHLARLEDPGSRAEATEALKTIVEEKRRKYRSPELGQHIKLVYLFLTEGLQGLAKGQTLPDEHEEAIQRAFERDYGGEKPRMIVLGIRQLRPVFALIEARSPGVRLSQFLLRPDGKGGYDTPKIAAALIQLARREYMREEMFIRVDDDVQPTANGLRKLKGKYYELKEEKTNKHFCFSWNCEAEPLEGIKCQPQEGPDYRRLFGHFVNSYSIRTTFLTNDECRWETDEKGRPRPVPVAADPGREPASLNITHAKRFIDLFKLGRWGSNLDGPLSGAGLCFSPDSLVDLPPWCNANDLVMWIDDFIKFEMMRTYYGERFDDRWRALSSAEPGCSGFAQSRKSPGDFKVKDVAWSVTDYLDRLVMGCILSYCVAPGEYGGPPEGYGALLKERDHLAALRRWTGGMANELRKGATAHVRRVLLDWHRCFCAGAEDAEVEAGYIGKQAEEPAGFKPAPATTFFNSYTARQLMALDDGSFDLVERVFSVLARYLELKYQFWPHVVGVIDALSAQRRRKAAEPDSAIGDVLRTADWLFSGLEQLDCPYGRTSRACYALIARQIGAKDRDGKEKPQTQWLMQWNAKWGFMNLISGHKQDREGDDPKDPTDLCCIMRELHEELFGALPVGRLRVMFEALAADDRYTNSATAAWKDDHIASVVPSDKPPHNFPEYVDFSERYRQWTLYQFKVYDVGLTPRGYEGLFEPEPLPPPSSGKPEGPNEWVSLDDIRRGWTAMGRPISKSAVRLLQTFM